MRQANVFHRTPALRKLFDILIFTFSHVPDAGLSVRQDWHRNIYKWNRYSSKSRGIPGQKLVEKHFKPKKNAEFLFHRNFTRGLFFVHWPCNTLLRVVQKSSCAIQSFHFRTMWYPEPFSFTLPITKQDSSWKFWTISVLTTTWIPVGPCL